MRGIDKNKNKLGFFGRFFRTAKIILSHTAPTQSLNATTDLSEHENMKVSE